VTPEDNAETIRKRMAELRRELAIDVRCVGRSARAMAKPSFYVRRFPWATLAVASTVGYLLVPKKRQVVHPDPKMLAELVRKNQIQIDTSKASKESKGMLETLAVMGLSWAARAGLNYLGQRLMHPSPGEPHQAESASPLEKTGKRSGKSYGHSDQSA
jgi:hypothetical protein